MRGLLARLQPLPSAVETDGRVSTRTLDELLRGLADGWRRSGSGALQVELDLQLRREGLLPRDLALAPQMP